MADRINTLLRTHPIRSSSLAIFLLILIVTALQPPRTEAQKVSDRDLEELVLTLSEQPGYFNTDNLISNESSFLQVLPRLQSVTTAGQAYIGVGPDQNFTYIVHVRPEVAILIDLRRDNLLEHLFLKQLVETSVNRWHYLSQLFGKPLASDFGESTAADADQLAQDFRHRPSNHDFFQESFEKAWSGLRGRFPRLVQSEDRPTVYKIARAFYEENLDLKYRSHGRRPRAYYPSFEQLMTETDRVARMGHYLNSESDFQLLKGLHAKNRIIPVIGNLAGPKALKNIATYLREEGYVVSAFYVSNVEFYIFRSGVFESYIENLTSLPVDETSVIIRSYFNYWRQHPETVPGYYVTSLLQSIEVFLKLHELHPYRNYWDVVTRDFIPTVMVEQTP